MTLTPKVKRILTIIGWLGAIAWGILALVQLLGKEYRKVG